MTPELWSREAVWTGSVMETGLPAGTFPAFQGTRSDGSGTDFPPDSPGEMNFAADKTVLNRNFRGCSCKSVSLELERLRLVFDYFCIYKKLKSLYQ